MVMKYRGSRTDSGIRVLAGKEELPHRRDLVDQGPIAYGWGYRGREPLQLAVALLAHATGDDVVAKTWYEDFADEVLQNIQFPEWEMDRPYLCGWVRARQEAAAKLRT